MSGKSPSPGRGLIAVGVIEDDAPYRSYLATLLATDTRSIIIGRMK